MEYSSWRSFTSHTAAPTHAECKVLGTPVRAWRSCARQPELPLCGQHSLTACMIEVPSLRPQRELCPSRLELRPAIGHKQVAQVRGSVGRAQACGLSRGGRRASRPYRTLAGGTYSITSSARARSVGGIVRPRAFAVLRLKNNSYVVGCMIGKSAGFSPLRIRAT